MIDRIIPVQNFISFMRNNTDEHLRWIMCFNFLLAWHRTELRIDRCHKYRRWVMGDVYPAYLFHDSGEWLTPV